MDSSPVSGARMLPGSMQEPSGICLILPSNCPIPLSCTAWTPILHAAHCPQYSIPAKNTLRASCRLPEICKASISPQAKVGYDLLQQFVCFSTPFTGWSPLSSQITMDATKSLTRTDQNGGQMAGNTKVASACEGELTGLIESNTSQVPVRRLSRRRLWAPRRLRQF
jgi:hypothetical protein